MQGPLYINITNYLFTNESVLRCTYIHKPRNTSNSCYTQHMKIDSMTALK